MYIYIYSLYYEPTKSSCTPPINMTSFLNSAHKCLPHTRYQKCAKPALMCWNGIQKV